MIEVDNLVKYYGDFKAVDNITFRINRGEVVGLLGPNGAGKSSTIRTLCGYLSPTSGTIKIDGIDVLTEPSLAKKKIGYLPESAPVYAEMMVYDYLKYVAEIRPIEGKSVDEQIKDTAIRCGLRPVMHKNISDISKGYRQRVGLAHALIGDPDILVLDEPTSGLDPNQIVEIRKLIREISQEKTIILCSHILSEVEATCDRIIIIDRGKVVANDSTKNVVGKNQSEKKIFLDFDLSDVDYVNQGNEGINTNKIVETLEALPFGLSVTKLDQTTENQAGNQTEKGGIIALEINYTAEQDYRKDIVKAIMNKSYPLVSFYQERKSLESVFRDLTKTA